MLFIVQRPGESISISLASTADPDMTIAELFSGGPLEINIIEIRGKRVRVGVDAPKQLGILRNTAKNKPQKAMMDD